MRLANGFGSVHKLGGNRRKPWRARKTSRIIKDENGKAKQEYITIGYYETKQQALDALGYYNTTKYIINDIKFSELYDRWSEEHFKNIVPSAARTWKSAYNHSAPLHNMKMSDIKTIHLEQAILNAQVGANTKSRMKSMFNLMYKYGMKHELVNKNYAELCNSVKTPAPAIERIPFSNEEIKLLWDNLQFPFVDMVLIGIYTGFRPQELAILELSNIDLDNQTIKGGIKTKAGRDRIVPIHHDILELVQNRVTHATSLNSDKLFNDENAQQGMTLSYDKYRNRFLKINKRFNLNHKAHDTRHTFITLAKQFNVNEYMLKLLVGHSIKDITESTYTHRTIEDLRSEINKIKIF